LASFLSQVHTMIELDGLAQRYRITEGNGFRLKEWDPADTARLDDKAVAQEALADSVARLADMRDRFYAQDRWSVLLILQGMDGAGKDSTIKHVMSGVNPQGWPGHLLQATLGGGAGSRLHVALHPPPP